MSERAVTVLISRSVKTGFENDFERVCETLIRVASDFEGFLGAQLVHPGDDPDVQDFVHYVVLAFDSQGHLDAWHDSSERQLGLAASQPFIEGMTRVKPVSGLGL